MLERVVIPPVVTVSVESGIDVMIASNSARRLADLRGFSPVYQAIVASAVHVLAELVIKTHQAHVIEIHGVRGEGGDGLLISCSVEWIKGSPQERILHGLQAKLDGLADNITIQRGAIPVIELFIKLTDERQKIKRLQLKDK